jgi:hypothetical protein
MAHNGFVVCRTLAVGGSVIAHSGRQLNVAGHPLLQTPMQSFAFLHVSLKATAQSYGAKLRSKGFLRAIVPLLALPTVCRRPAPHPHEAAGAWRARAAKREERDPTLGAGLCDPDCGRAPISANDRCQPAEQPASSFTNKESAMKGDDDVTVPCETCFARKGAPGNLSPAAALSWPSWRT